MKDVCSSSAHITIVGCYYCSGNVSADTVPPFFEKIAATVKKQNGTCVQAVLKNSLLLSPSKDRLALTASRDAQEVHCGVNSLTHEAVQDPRAEPTCAAAHALLAKLLDQAQAQGLQYLIVDAEDYLAGDCDSDRAEVRDFRNRECGRVISTLLG